MLCVNFYARITCEYFACKSAILHPLYAHVGAAIPVTGTVHLTLLKIVVDDLVCLSFKNSSESFALCYGYVAFCTWTRAELFLVSIDIADSVTCTYNRFPLKIYFLGSRNAVALLPI